MNKKAKLFTHCDPDVFQDIKYRPTYIITRRKTQGQDEAVEISRLNPLSFQHNTYHVNYDKTLCYMEKCKECKYGLRHVLNKCKTSKYYESI